MTIAVSPALPETIIIGVLGQLQTSALSTKLTRQLCRAPLSSMSTFSNGTPCGCFDELGLIRRLRPRGHTINAIPIRTEEELLVS